ncbi:MAG: nuclear transport factor 2 family protein [Cellvibrionaceae bacterium]|nr:nuclear transport factor 2 family protein [Cellvibrionaceae bacterium]
MPEQSDYLKQLDARLTQLEDEKKVSAVMNRYMPLCDDLRENTDISSIVKLFTADAIWRGERKRYSKTVPKLTGRGEIEAMFSRCVTPPVHFDFNAHFLFLCNETITASGNSAQGSWMMLQPSTFKDGQSQRSGAFIQSKFTKSTIIGS